MNDATKLREEIRRAGEDRRWPVFESKRKELFDLLRRIGGWPSKTCRECRAEEHSATVQTAVTEAAGFLPTRRSTCCKRGSHERGGFCLHCGFDGRGKRS